MRRVTCETCAGEGVDPDDQDVVCPDCLGDGEVELEEDEE